MQCITIFPEDGPHGEHFCLVCPPFGPNIADLRRPLTLREFPLSAVKTVLKHTLLALDFLHTHVNAIHLDVKAENLLVNLPINQRHISEFLRSNPPQVYAPQASRSGNPPSVTTVRSQPLPAIGLDRSMSNLHVVLGDYSSAMWVGTDFPGEHVTTPRVLRAPELLLGHRWSTPVDIWALGCMAFELLAPDVGPLFRMDRGSDSYTVQEHLAHIAERLGPFPPAFLAKCSKTRDYFDPSGNLRKFTRPSSDPFEVSLRGYPALRDHLSGEDVNSACRFIRRCLSIDPDDRPTAAHLLEDEFLARI
ncbi:kinase-like protein [Trametes cingulata]|nr:kinase-like protein [Trametes cingulata]